MNIVEIYKKFPTKKNAEWQTSHEKLSFQGSQIGKRIFAETEGAFDVCAFQDGQIHYQELPAFLNKSVIDAIGAGDSFNAGFIHKFIQREPVEVCQEFGNLTAAISTQAAGGTAAFNDFEKRLKNAIEQYGIINA